MRPQFLFSHEAGRNRVRIALALLAVIALGLASRRFPGMLPEILGKYPGDALWALMIFLGLAFVSPRSATVRLGLMAFGISCAVEAAQLYQAPWINDIRQHPLGHLVLGTTFSWMDIVAYGIGILVGILLDHLTGLIKA
jgi:hypothetical protein